MVPWNRIKYIIDKCGDDSQKALFYIRETIQNNWFRAVLLNFLGTNLYEKKGKAVTNFPSAMPECKGGFPPQPPANSLKLRISSMASEFFLISGADNWRISE